MSNDLLNLYKVTDNIIIDLLSSQDSSTQRNLETVIQARSKLIEAMYLLYNVGIRDAGEGCDFDFGVGCDKDGVRCSKYDFCKRVHERYFRLLGCWKITKEEKSKE